MKINKKLTAGILTAAMFFTMVPAAYANEVTDESKLPVNEQVVKPTEEKVDLSAQKTNAKAEVKKLYDRYMDLEEKDIKDVNSKIDKAATEEEIHSILKEFKDKIYKMEKKNLDEFFVDINDIIKEMGDILTPSEIAEVRKAIDEIKGELNKVTTLDELEVAQLKILKNALNEGIDQLIPSLDKLNKELTKKQLDEIKSALVYIKDEINKIETMDQLDSNIDRIMETAVNMISDDTIEVLTGIMFGEDEEEPVEESVVKTKTEEKMPNTPETGDSVGLGILVALAAISLIGTFLLKKRK